MCQHADEQLRCGAAAHGVEFVAGARCEPCVADCSEYALAVCAKRLRAAPASVAQFAVPAEVAMLRRAQYQTCSELARACV